MSTTITPATIANTKAEVPIVESWLKTHERILIVALIVFASLFIASKFLDTIATRDRAAATQAAQVLTQQQAINTALAAQIAKTQEDYKALVVQLTQQNAVLQTQMTQRTVVLQQQVAVDKSLPLPDLGNRWAELAALKPSDIAASTSGITVTPQGALDTVTKLEQLPVAESNLTDVTTQRDNLTKELTGSDTLNSQLTQQVTGLQTAAIDASKVCKTDIASAKADARKGKLKAFLYGAGVGAGVVTAFVIHALL